MRVGDKRPCGAESGKSLLASRDVWKRSRSTWSHDTHRRWIWKMCVCMEESSTYSMAPVSVRPSLTQSRSNPCLFRPTSNLLICAAFRFTQRWESQKKSKRFKAEISKEKDGPHPKHFFSGSWRKYRKSLYSLRLKVKTSIFFWTVEAAQLVIQLNYSWYNISWFCPAPGGRSIFFHSFEKYLDNY